MNKKIFLYAVIFITVLFPVVLGFDYLMNDYFYPYDVYYALASVAGLVAFGLLFWQYTLGIRQISGLVTNDLIGINTIHKFLGIYGFFLILMHPALMFVEYWMNRNINLIIFSVSTQNDVFISVGKIAFFLIFFIWATSKILRTKLSYRTWKLFHLTTYIVLPLVFIHARMIGKVFNNTAVEYYITFLFVLFVCFVIYRILLQVGILKRKYKVVNVKKVTHDVVEITLKPLGRIIQPKSGQFVYFQIKWMSETHPFTVSNYDSETKQIKLTIKNSGPYTKQIHQINEGQTVYLDGPYGVFTKGLYDKSCRDVVIIAGGIGITPFLQFFASIGQIRDDFGDIVFLYGNKTKEDIIYKDLIKQVSDQNGITNINVLSNVEISEVGFEKGFINFDLINKYTKNEYTNYGYFICGPVVMMHKITQELIKNGVPKERIYKEEFSF